MSKNLYIVPHDLTEVGNIALEYALHICKRVNAEVRLLHLVSSASKAPAAHAKLDEITRSYEIPEKAELTKVVIEGSIFEDIGRIATEAGAQLIIMGTHGQTGMQKLFGSHAIKVITSVDIPFLIVQKNIEIHDISKIVIPIDLTKESLQIINLAGDIANIYGASIDVIGAKQSDESLSQQMKNRIMIVKNKYDERHIPCNVELLPDGGSYAKKVMQYTSEKKGDMIAFAYHTESILPQFDTFAQNLITNELKLPCLVINSKLASALYY